jgi:hypothetical protein
MGGGCQVKQPILTAGALRLLRILKISDESSKRYLGDVIPSIGAIAPIATEKEKADCFDAA